MSKQNTKKDLGPNSSNQCSDPSMQFTNPNFDHYEKASLIIGRSTALPE